MVASRVDEEIAILRSWKRMTAGYDETAKLVNDAYRGNPDIPIRTLAHDLGVPFDVVWECLGFRDWFDFGGTGDE